MMTSDMFSDAAVQMLRGHEISEPTIWRDRLCRCSGCEFAKDILGMPKLAGDWTRFPEGAEL